MSERKRILRMRTVLQRTDFSRSAICRKMKDGTFPGQVSISLHGRGWHESAIARWIADPVSYTEKAVVDPLDAPPMNSRRQNRRLDGVSRFP